MRTRPVTITGFATSAPPDGLIATSSPRPSASASTSSSGVQTAASSATSTPPLPTPACSPASVGRRETREIAHARDSADRRGGRCRRSTPGGRTPRGRDHRRRARSRPRRRPAGRCRARAAARPRSRSSSSSSALTSPDTAAFGLPTASRRRSRDDLREVLLGAAGLLEHRLRLERGERHVVGADRREVVRIELERQRLAQRRARGSPGPTRTRARRRRRRAATAPTPRRAPTRRPSRRATRRSAATRPRLRASART